MMGKVEAVKSIIYFVLAGLCEIGGGYLVWLWLREGKSVRQQKSKGVPILRIRLPPTARVNSTHDNPTISANIKSQA